MSEWKEYRLGDIAEIVMGQSPTGDTCNNQGIGTPLLNGPTEFSTFHPIPTQFTTDPKRYSEIGDILFCVRGSTTGKMNWSDQIYAIGRGIGAIRHRQDLKCNHFIRAIIQFNLPILLQSANGSTFPNVSREQLNGLRILAPDLPTQTSIAEILSSLDDKIELNNKINQELEALAQTLFKRWFVDFEFPNEIGEPYKSSGGEMVDSELGEIPKGWVVKRLKQLLTIKRGGSPRPIHDFMAESGLPWVKISDATALNSPFLFSTKEFIKVEGLRKTVLLKKGSLILSNSATPGLPKFLELDACIHDGWLHFEDIQQLTFNYLYLLFISIRVDLVGQGNGSVFINLKTDILKEYAITAPNAEVINNFSNIIDPIFDQIKKVSSEIIHLTKLRDTLLPKLISGELEVS